MGTPGVTAPEASRTASARQAALMRRFDERPLLVFWEMTKACDLACFHCRASAQPMPTPNELTTDEGRRLIDELAGIGSPRPILILTGGDCLKRDDLVTLLDYASERYVPVALAPSVTPLLTPTMMRTLRDHGVKTVSISLDGCDGATHDAVRGIPGHFERTMRVLRELKQEGFTVQINTTVMSSNVHQLADIAALLQCLRLDIWEVFFLIATGRGTEVLASSPHENEDVCHFLVDAAAYGFTVRTVEGPFFRRVAGQRVEGDVAAPATGALYESLRLRLGELLGPPTHAPRLHSAATRDGKGIIFVSATGDVHASGFLPLALGNVRDRSLLAMYRDDETLRAIRASAFEGPCALCDYAQTCGGSRARAFASTGNPLASDPACLLVAG